MAWDDWFVDDSAGWGDVSQAAAEAPVDTGGYDWSSMLQSEGGYGGDYWGDAASSAASDGYTYTNEDFVGPTKWWGGSDDSGGGGYTYTNSDFVGPPRDLYAPQQADPYSLAGIWDLMGQAGKASESPAGKFGIGLLGAGVSAFGANKANKQAKEAWKKHQAMLAARQAKAAQYDSPLRLASARRAAAAPQARNGETEFFAENRIPAYAEGGSGISEEDFQRMQQEAYQGTLDARMDRPSAMGFLRYMMAGKRMPSELAAAKRAQRPSTVDVITTRNRALDEAANYAEGGSSNYVRGGSAGQDDKIPAMLSDGEYVFDADTVAALGDGNNEAGAARLDEMRKNVRAHKRSAPAHKIPPKAKSPLAYMKKGK